MAKLGRKYMAHYLDAAFDVELTAPNYVRLGKDLEEFSVEMNPDVTMTKNILDETSVTHNGYEVSEDTDPFYYEYDDALSQKILDIALGRLKDDDCKTTYVEVMLKPGENGAKPTVDQAWREEVYVVPNSYGGDASGVQVPFKIYHTGVRVKGTFDLDTKTFTAETAA